MRPTSTARRFLREAQVAARLDHPGIVRVHDAGCEAGRVYVVMDYVEGRNLEELADDRGGRLPAVEALRYVGQTAAALAFAHEKGVVHRDIKPANLIRRAHDRRVIVLDFGLARTWELDPLSTEGRAMGTPAYMARERPPVLCRRVEDHRRMAGDGDLLYFRRSR